MVGFLVEVRDVRCEVFVGRELGRNFWFVYRPRRLSSASNASRAGDDKSGKCKYTLPYTSHRFSFSI